MVRLHGLGVVPVSGSGLRQRLAAILAADAVGYSRLMSLDERGTVNALDAARKVFRTHIESNRGRVIDMAGDSVLAVFETASGAVNAAMAIQAEVNPLADAAPEDRRMRFRIGVHLGDVIEKDDGTVYGDGVNIAARLEGLAETGGVTVSESIHTAVRGKISATFIDQGEQQVKNIAQPVRAYRVQVGEQADPVTAAAKPVAAEIDLSLPDKPSIAVLPFTNMSGDPEQEYFTDGVTEDIITELSRFHSLFVIARNSSFSYKGKSPDIRQVGRELGVRYVLEGSIRKSVNRIRVTGQLIDASTGSHIWAEKYDRVLEDVFTLQEELTRSIIAAIAPRIDAAEQDRARRHLPQSLSAYQIAVRAWAKAMEALFKSDRPLREAAILEAKQALAIDARSTLALNTLAFAQWQYTRLGTPAERAQAWEHGMAAANTSIEVDPTGNVGYMCRGMLLNFAPDRSRVADALADLRHAYELNPNDTRTLQQLALAEVFAGNPEEAITLSRMALRISPRDPVRGGLYHVMASSCLCLGQYAQGIEYNLIALRESLATGGVYANMAMLYVGLGDIAKAKIALEEERRLGQGSAMIERGLAGGLSYRNPVHLRRVTTFLRVAAGLEDPSAADALR